MLDLLAEFLIVAKRLNITHAARDLNMTQPNLSRHIKQIEGRVGFRLFIHSDNRIALTNAGRVFADELEPILSQYDKLVEKCKQINLDTPLELKVQEPPYQDGSITAYISLLERIKDKYPFVSERYILPSRILPEECVKQKILDIALLHLCTPIEKALTQFADKGFSCCHLGSVPIGIWVDESSELSTKKEISLEELGKVRILTPNDTYSPTRDALKMLFETHGIEPLFTATNTKSQTEFMRYRNRECAFVFPQSMRQDFRLISRRDLRYIPGSQELTFEVFAIARMEDNLF